MAHDPSSTSRSTLRLVLVTPVALLVGYALWLAAEQYAFRSGATRVVGTVVEHQYTESERPHPRTWASRPETVRYTYYVVSYTDTAGREYRTKSTVGSGEPRYPVGAKVGVHYDPAQPHVARLDDAQEIWFMSALIVGVTFGFVLVGYLVALKPRSGRQSGES